MPSAEQREQLAALDAELKSLQQKLDTQTPELDKALQAWAVDLQTKQKAAPKVWQPVDVVDMKSDGGQTLTLQDDGSVLGAGTHPRHDTYKIAIGPAVGKVTAVRLETIRHDSFARKSLSRGNGNFVLSNISVTHIKNADGRSGEVAIKEAITSFEQKSWPVKTALDGKSDTGWAVDGQVSSDRDPIAVFRFKQPVEIADGDRLVVQLEQKAVEFHNIGRFRLTTSTTDDPQLDDNTLGIPSQFLATITKWPQVEDAERQALAKHYRSIAPALADSRTRLASQKKAKEELDKQIPLTLITQTQNPREIRVLARGNWMDDSGAVVTPAVPHFLTQLSKGQRASRLDLAQWFVNKDNPLVARVFVNRLWKQFFGTGIVKSGDDFGSQGTWPSHPELLDWLAVEFQESGWDIQHIIRLIVSSDAYRRTSQSTPKLTEADPFNKWLARQSRYRLDAELIRDAALSVSGLLVDKVGGRSVKPYQTAGYWAHLNFPKRAWTPDSGDDQHRRGLYTYWCRTFLHPAMRSFDAPSREECTVDRPRSNNSLQALVLLNDPSYVEAARGLAIRALTEGGTTTSDRVAFVYQICLSRQPRPEEVSVLTNMLNEQATAFAADAGGTAEFLKVGQASAPTNLNPSELAAWTAVARVVLNLHEAITRT